MLALSRSASYQFFTFGAAAKNDLGCAQNPHMATDSPAAPMSWRVPLIVAASFFMETLDGSIIVTALPSIAKGFGETTLALSVGISAYLVAVAVFVPTAGWISERFGARNVFAAAVGTFT